MAYNKSRICLIALILIIITMISTIALADADGYEPVHGIASAGGSGKYPVNPKGGGGVREWLMAGESAIRVY